MEIDPVTNSSVIRWNTRYRIHTIYIISDANYLAINIRETTSILVKCHEDWVSFCVASREVSQAETRVTYIAFGPSSH